MSPGHNLNRTDFGVPRWFLALATLCLLTAAAAGAAVAADDTAPAGKAGREAPVVSFPAQPSPANRPGFISELGHWWDGARGQFDEFTNRSGHTASGAAAAGGDVMGNAAAVTRDAVNAIVRLPNMRMIEVHERCELAPNGAPNCQAAATNVCRAKGFSAGQVMGVSSSENCPTAVLLSGRAPLSGECPIETDVLIVACQ